METQPLIRKESIPQRIRRSEPAAYKPLSLKERIFQFEGGVLQNMLRKYGTSVEAKKLIAKELNISLATLYRKLEEQTFLNIKKHS
jgi:transcriptional regulator with PAS, ATPase and Fis domain